MVNRPLSICKNSVWLRDLEDTKENIISAHNKDNRADINMPKGLLYIMLGNLFQNKELRIKLVNF